MNWFFPSGSVVGHCEDAVHYFLRNMGYKPSKSIVESDLLQHPDYPSLLSVTDVLATYHFSIDTWKVPYADFANFVKKPGPQLFPLLVPIRGNDLGHDIFAVVTHASLSYIWYYSPQHRKTIKVTHDDFGKIYKGILVIASSKESSDKGSDRHKAARLKDLMHSLLIVLVMLPLPLLAIIKIIFNAHNISLIQFLLQSAYLSVGMVGLAIGVLLIWHEVDRNNPFLRQFCEINAKFNCTAVLTSKGAKIFGSTWSRIGFAYFFAQLFFLLIADFSDGSISLPAALSLFALPYIGYSIYYQKKIAKQWCRLCLLTQVVLLLQGVISSA